MNVTKTYNENELTIEVEGRIDTATASDFEKELNDEVGNFDSLILDFAELKYISSTGLRVLIEIQKKLKSENVPMTLRNVNEDISKIFSISGFDKLLTIE